jgi:hypothetical protein
MIDLSRSSMKMIIPDFGHSTDSGNGDFVRYTADALVRSQGMAGASLGDCAVYTFAGEETPADPIQPLMLDAGPSLLLTGQKGQKQLSRKQDGSYDAGLGGGPQLPGMPPGAPLDLDSGVYGTGNGNRGADVGPFQAQIRIPGSLNWSNQEGIDTVSRRGGLEITWSSADPAGEYVIMTGFSLRADPDGGGFFVCAERTSAGRFVVPALVLSALPPSAEEDGFPARFLTVGSSPLTDGSRFNAPGLDLGWLSYYASSMKAVKFE